MKFLRGFNVGDGATAIIIPINVNPIGNNTPKFDVIVVNSGSNIVLVKVKPSIFDLPFSNLGGNPPKISFIFRIYYKVF